MLELTTAHRSPLAEPASDEPAAATAFPLWPLQAAMIRDTLDSLDGRHIVQVEVRFTSACRWDDVARAWEETARQSDALSTRIGFEAGEPRVLVHEIPGAMLRILDEPPASWDDWREDDRRSSLPREDGLPWRAVFCPQDRRFVWTYHEALLDTESAVVLLRAFIRRVEGGPDPGRLALHGARSNDSSTALSPRDPSVVEPFRIEFPAAERGDPVTVRRSLGADVSERLEATARRLDVSAESLVTWAWAQVVVRSSGARTVVVGRVDTGPPDVDRVGFRTRRVPVVVDRFSCEQATAELQAFHAGLRAVTFGKSAMPDPRGRHTESWPGGVVDVEEGTTAHRVGPSAMVESVRRFDVVREPLHARAWIRPGCELEVTAGGDGLGGPAATSLLDQWVAVVGKLADSAGSPCVTRLPGGMARQLSIWESGGPEHANLHLAQAWKGIVKSYGDLRAIESGGRSLSYTDLARAVDGVARDLCAKGVCRGSTVAGFFRDSSQVALALLACSRVGAVVVPLDPEQARDRLRALVRDSSPCLVLTDDPDACKGLGVPVSVPGPATDAGCPAPWPDDPSDPISLVVEERADAVPRMVAMAHGGLVNQALGVAELAGIRAGDRILQLANPDTSESPGELLMTLLKGATLVSNPGGGSAIPEIHRFVSKQSITVLRLSVDQWTAWCSWMSSSSESLPDSLRTVIVVGGRVSALAVEDWFGAGGRRCVLLHTRGPAEASGVATVERIDGSRREEEHDVLGRPLPGVVARIAGVDGNRLPPGAAGELWLGGICVAAGYGNQPEATRTKFPERLGRRWFRTGLRACWDSNGRLVGLSDGGAATDRPQAPPVSIGVMRSAASAPERETESPIIQPIRPGGDIPPLFCIHGGDGRAVFYQDMAGNMPAGRPVIAIEAPSLGAPEMENPVSVEETARRYVDLMRLYQAEGPYLLVGYSFGGLLVYEIARALIDGGEHVGFAGMVDTVNPVVPRPRCSFGGWLRNAWTSRRPADPIGRIVKRVAEGMFSDRRERAELRAAHRCVHSEPYSDTRRLQVRVAHEESLAFYKPRPVDCHLVLFKAQTEDERFDLPPDFGWSRLVRSLEIVKVPGDHRTLFDSRHAGTIAYEIAMRL